MKSKTLWIFVAVVALVIGVRLFTLPPPSFLMRITSLIIARHHATKTTSELDQEYIGRVYPTPALITRSLQKLADIREQRVLGFPVYTLTPKNHASPWHIIYFHGGGYVSELVKPHWNIIEKLMRATGATITVPIYPLAPEHDHNEAVAFFDTIYKDILHHLNANHLVLCGDSSGANAALLQAIRARDQKLPLPKYIILFSPWLDLTASNPEIAVVQPRDIMLRASESRVWGKWWAGSDDPRSPNLSPIFADLHNLPLIQIYQGTNDITWPDAKKLRDRINAIGGKVELYETEGAFHDFMAATFTPESHAVFNQIGLTLGNLNP